LGSFENVNYRGQSGHGARDETMARCLLAMRPEPERGILQLARGVEMAFRRIVPAGPFGMGNGGFHAPAESIHRAQMPSHSG
jgi:hypothetical protein